MIDQVARLLSEQGLKVAVAESLRARGLTLAVAESCTGGRLAAAFTAAAGASEYFVGGVVAYSNDVKAGVLGVSAATLATHGAVSREVAVEMASGVRLLTGADCAIATTGIAGPGGGSPQKPVGTVWIAVSVSVSQTADAVSVTGLLSQTPDGDSDIDTVAGGQPRSGTSSQAECAENVAAQCFHFAGSRERIMAQAVEAAIEMLSRQL
ncbi:MAG: nicotinamide-nucleotide amidohydrolase family protein [Alistipes sp.]|jgi:PncC family amidohydrolase|nr:nicotinamide-nucleotide amidohydrolase family protein [Alistipes sp.]